MSAEGHDVAKTLVRLSKGTMLRARCACGGFEYSVSRLSTAARRMQDRKIREHLDQVSATLQAAE